jgi:hypothetical protein
VELVDGLANTAQPDIPDVVQPLFDVNSAMAMLALNSLTVNLDSYSGSGHNYYFYHRDSDDRFVFMPWDANEAWGCFSMGMSIPQLMTLPPIWSGGPPQARPLCFKTWGVPEYQELFAGHIRRLMAGGADPDTLLARMEEIRDMVRPYVYSDTKKMYTDQQFEDAMTLNIGGGPGGASPALDPFIRTRHDHLSNVLGNWAPPEGIVINELMAANDTTASDEFGEFDDWVEIANVGTAAVALDTLSLTDDPADPTAYVFPSVTLNPGEYFLVWADDEPSQGDQHAPFKLSAGGETVYLMQGGNPVDVTTFHDLDDDEAFGRLPDGADAWTSQLVPTPEATNQAAVGSGDVVINEFLASNENGLPDETGEPEDWVELYNPGASDVDLTGYYMTDDLADPTQWAFPAVSIPAGGYLLLWCDDDTGDGPLHTNFKLGASGEEIGVFGPDATGNSAIDTYVFGGQTTDVSEGRDGDGADSWTFFNEPTPEATNVASCPSPNPYGIGKVTSLDEVPVMYYSGTPSAAADDLDLVISLARPGQPGIAFFGSAATELPFMGGTRWVAGPIVRLPVQMMDSNGAATYSIPIDSSMVGESRYYQGWFRDPGHADGFGVGLTNGMAVSFCP